MVDNILSSSSDFPTPISTGDVDNAVSTDSEKRRSNAGAIAGGVIGGLAALGILIGLVLWRRRTTSAETHIEAYWNEKDPPLATTAESPPVERRSESSDISAVGSLAVFSSKTREEYKEWEKRHADMVKTPPTEGKQYLTHALNLVRLFEGLGELHPIAKAVVVTFKSVLLFEKDRKENNARVQSVLLAQTDMMHVFIELVMFTDNPTELERLNKLRVADGEEEIPDVDTDALADLGRRIERDIKDCGNSFDTYYSERKLVKFFKSDEWKQRMNAYVQTFTDHKIHIQTLLAFQTQRGIHDLSSKLQVLLDTLFKPGDDEQNLVTQARTLGHPRVWLRDDTRIERLLTITNDATFNRPVLAASGDHTATAENEGRKKAIIQEVREELTTPLQDLCQRNFPFFEQKLDFHTEQLKEAISASAQTVIRALQGPYDRLNHEDLRELWKEMNWIFCVDNRQFLFALQEYYLDRFVKYQRNSSEPIEGTEVALANDGEARETRKHPDAWTLFYLGRYADRILDAIDKDNSGLIRISEANDFTIGMPASWSLPQWCTYHAIGWLYENRIYQLRIRKLFIKLCEAQVHAHPLNRQFMSRILDYLTSSYLLLSTRPSGVEQSPPPELVELVKSKIVDQDKRYRKSLAYFQKLGINASSISLVFRDQEVESYILMLITLLLEEYLKIFELCSTEILDAREFLRILMTTDDVMSLVINRIVSLQDELKRNADLTFEGALVNFRGGIFAAYFKNMILDEGLVSEMRSLINVSTHLNDLSLLNGFSPEEIYGTGSPVLHYSTWSQHAESSEGEVDVDDDPPVTWGSETDSVPIPQWEHTDFCHPCWHSGQTHTEGHVPNHPTVRLSLNLPFGLRLWVIALAEYQLSKLTSDIVTFSLKNQSLVKGGETEDDEQSGDVSLITETSLPCKRCGNALNLQSTLYVCVMHDCKDHIICENCVDEEPIDEGDHHEPWHNMLAAKNLLIVLHPNQDPELAHATAQPTKSETHATDTDVRIQKLEERVAALETELRTANNDIKGMIMELLSISKTNNTISTRGPGTAPAATDVHSAGPVSDYGTPRHSDELSEELVVSGFGSSAMVPTRGVSYTQSTDQSPSPTGYSQHAPSATYHPPLHPPGSGNSQYQDEYADDDEEEEPSGQYGGNYYPYLQGPPPDTSRGPYYDED
ncbi:hypothetical protein CVT24_003678 [Panaeolus cyanescens]|uniref:EF-hand domain-containing protein n=1 Tax=Panaeolus cyanescens TaxID=181874 RepID=A0A409VUP2_9AGAR|nr:hypothetical protein CVT24_003678 [Panaeolus cyanescens]